jgi:hypothetical protein
MGMFAETAIIDYRLSFASQGKQTSVFRFGLQQTDFCFPFWFAANKQKFAVFLSVCGKQKEVAVFRIYIYIYIVSPSAKDCYLEILVSSIL